jgi:hypothetical protein
VNWRNSSRTARMSQIRGTAGYNLGGQNTFGGPSRNDSMADPSPLDAIREQTGKIEDFLDTLSDPVKPYVSPSERKDPPRSRWTESCSDNTSWHSIAHANISILQISTSNWAFPHCCYFLGRRAQNHYTMERSAIIPSRLPTQ